MTLVLAGWMPAPDPLRADVPVHSQAPASSPAESKSLSILGWNAAPIDDPLVTDRPDFTESPEAVPTGRIQLELGYTFTYDREGRERDRTHTAPEMLWRIGLAPDWELRIGWGGYAYAEQLSRETTRAGRPVSREDWSQGADDLTLGFKVKLLEQDRIVPHLGVIGELTLPTGSAGVSSGDVDPALILAWAYDLTERLAIAGNVGLAVPTEDGDRFLQTTASLTTSLALTDRLGAYVEYFGFYPDAVDSDAAHSLDGGLVYLITNNLQFDAFAGFGLNEQADDFFAGVGISWRF